MVKALIIAVTITAYSNEVRQTDSSPNITAFNKRVHNCGLAVSRNLEDIGFKNGCRVQIIGATFPGSRLDGKAHCGGLFVVNDRMHYRWLNRVDIFYFDTSKAWKFGKQKGKIRLLWCN